MTGAAKEPPLSRYMRVQAVADQLAIARTSVYPLLSSHGGPIEVAPVTPGGELRVVRASFEAYCTRVEADAARRFGATA